MFSSYPGEDLLEQHVSVLVIALALVHVSLREAGHTNESSSQHGAGMK